MMQKTHKGRAADQKSPTKIITPNKASFAP
jgi:hypothetical protein